MRIGLGQVVFNESPLHIQLRKRNAETAYQSFEKYSGQKQMEVQQFLTEKPARKSELGAGQVKQVHLPIGKTLEETIALWRDVRSEALSVPEPTTADYQLAVKASSQIRHAEAQIGLHQKAQTEINSAVQNEKETAVVQSAMEFPTAIERELFELEKKYERAIESYSYQVQMKMNGFQIEKPSFFKIA
ncbi:hypothetical protein [Sporosarcina pasteurii]|uniref:Uncharacterized protein n=1 Tax=Sporosarcina pasteurii TaxID=1474 RepID=A0A380BE68_SPOPA|nr:hypothetical protein [Sporosarcina pasteurii]MDS9472348.1 hypothetical protein [Sporosarcina pasteurii]QBQ06327.1 hypothetical protein E2C16_11890 [Sporosarcina pasteurii]SUI98952.1 Uncharacterised protein [Sporosarcina pasteurii]